MSNRWPPSFTLNFKRNVGGCWKRKNGPITHIHAHVFADKGKGERSCTERNIFPRFTTAEPTVKEEKCLQWCVLNNFA